MDGTDLRAARQCRSVIRGRLSDRLGFAFGQLSLERRPGQTVMHGLADSAQLDELLDRLGDLGLELVSVDVES